MIIEVNKSLTAANDALAAQLREELRAKGVFCLNIVSAPGSGKTALIEQTITQLKGTLRTAVIEGDPHTDLDSHRVRATGAVAVQINTEGGCHLDAAMIRRALNSIDLDQVDLLIIENVGNLLCPTFWDLGENLRVVMTSLPEGADKPMKYPEIFLLSHALIINKIDLEGLLKTTTADIRRNALLINAHLRVFALSCETGMGMEAWCAWIVAQCRQETA
jgi:hydrogenase nickel incorporation protein HypB